MTKNTIHLLKWYVVAAFFVGLLLFGLVSALLRGDSPVIFEIAFGILVAVLIMLRTRQKALLLFREPTPDRAIAYYHNSTRRIPNGKAMAAYLSAFAAVLYGDFDRAREELTAVNWTVTPPMYQGFEVYIRSLLSIFQTKNYAEALQFAKEARDLCEVSGKFQGAKTSRAAFDANIAVCNLLLGDSGPELLAQINSAAKTLPGVSPAISAWALATYHSGAGRPDVAEGYIAVVRRLLPHSVCLKDLSLSAK
jgi:hypothetical protein